MNLVKWFRKNNTKVMAIVVIVLMIGFVGGSSLTYLLRGSGGANKAIAYFGPGKHKITPNSRGQAGQELEMLQSLGAAQILQAQSLRGLILGELLFSQDRGSAELIDRAKQAIQRNGYRVSEKQLAAVYEERTVPPDIYWILLRHEAQSAGFAVPSEDVGPLLGRIVPQLFPGTTYAQVMQARVSRYGIPEQAILTTFGELLAVLQYAEAACSLEDVTSAEIRNLASFENQTLSAEMVQLKAMFFADKDATPTDDEIAAQFEKYKDYFPEQASEANPYGFGYKLPDRLQIEYIAADLQNVETTVSRPTAEQTEAYYQNNRERLYTQQVKADPNDPNSPEIQQVQPYAEVADSIADRLLREKVVRKAEQILLEARSRADAGLEELRSREKEPTIPELQKEAGKYEDIALALGQKHGVALYSGRTGLVSAADILADEYLGRLVLTGFGPSPSRLAQVLFSVQELGEDAITIMFAPRARLYATIGPARDPMADTARDLSDQIMAVVRIIAVEPAAPPQDANVTYSTKTLTMGDLAADDDESVHSVREKVIDDLRVLAAWETTKAKAQEFVELATKDGWDNTVSEFNERYGDQAKDDPNDPNVFELQNLPLPRMRRIANAQMEVFTAQAANIPGIDSNLRQAAIHQRFANRLYSLIPADSDSVADVPLVMEFKPDLSFYCFKSISIRRIDQQRFQSIKPSLLMQQDNAESQSLAVVHFNPANILKRMNFTFVKQPEPEAEDDEAGQTPEDATG
jgi:hypothetical protein